MAYLACDANNTIVAISEVPFTIEGINLVKVKLPKGTGEKIVGKTLSNKPKKAVKDLRVAVICNWKDACGIATYSDFLVKEIKKKVTDVHIFSEILPDEVPAEDNVTRCWKRGQQVNDLIARIKEYDPDLVIIQHEFGIFPRAGHFLQLLQEMDNYAHVLTLHSVYEHLDKAVCTSAIKNIVVHTEEGKQILRKIGNNNNIFVVPHGCVNLPEEERTELWNIFQTPYAIIQFGFGFQYKGVDTALEAVSLLKKSQPEKYKDIFYCYLCSENSHANSIHSNYINFLNSKIKEYGISDNVAIIRKYQTEKTISNYLRTAKLALFPYKSDPNNVVYGASGATRIAMSNGIPIITGSNHQFDDLKDVLPRAGTPEEMAREIDKVFSDGEYKKEIVRKALDYVRNNTWDKVADMYLALYEKVLPNHVFLEFES